MAIYFDKTTIKTGASGIPVIYEGENLDDVLEVQNTTITAQDDIIAQIQASVVDKCLKPEQTKTATPSLSQQTISPDNGKVLSEVTVEPITSTLLTSLDADFKAENIAEGVDLFGVAGTFAGGGTTLTVTTNEGVTVTVTDGTTTHTGVGPLAVFEGLGNGLWTVTASLSGASSSKTVELGNETVKVLSYNVYGISRDVTALYPEWTRTDDAVDLTATASVGTLLRPSDFDNCYPWSEIRRETLSTGDVMVRIPKFYYRRYQQGNIEYIKISDNKAPNFIIHPLFNHGGKESECAYVGAYKTSNNNRSVTGATPQTTKTRAAMRNDAKSKGTGWGLMDIAAVSAIQMLILVEFATNDVQAVIGRGYCDGTSGAPINVGSCDNVPRLTGRPFGTDGLIDVVWRGIEGFWGNLTEMIDGLNVNNGEYYVCNDQSKYADDTATGYSLLSYVGQTNWNGHYINRVGIDTGSNPHVMLPSSASGGSASTYQCDTVWSAAGWRYCWHGGAWLYGSGDGLFTIDSSITSSLQHNTSGSRLLYIPS